MTSNITAPSALFVTGHGYVGVYGAQMAFVSSRTSPHVVTFTPDNLGPRRRDNFHINLLSEVCRVHGPRARHWFPL